MEPALVGLLFADRVITEENGKKGIIGTFNRFISPQFPVNFPPWAIYAAVTNLQGSYHFRLELSSMETENVVFPITGDFTIQSLNDVAELVFQISNAVFPEPGRYSLGFSINGELIGSRILYVDRRDNPPQVG